MSQISFFRNPLAVAVSVLAKGILVLIALVLATSAAFLLLKDPVRFIQWKTAHPREFARYSTERAIIEQWSADGFAGYEDDSYFVSDPTDTLGQTAPSEEWIGVGNCERPGIRRLAAKFYILHTRNCPLLK